MINEEVRHLIEPELVEGEELLWADRPITALDYYYILLFILSIAGIYLFINVEWPMTELIRELIDQYPWALPLILSVSFIFAIRYWFIKTEVYAITNKNVFIHSMIPTRYTHKIPFSSVIKAKQSFFSGRDTINLTLKGKDARKSKTPIVTITLGFSTRVIVQIKQVSNPRVPLEIISNHMEATP